MYRFASRFCTPINTCRIIIVIIRLPHHRRISRLSHPGHDTWCIFPHTIQPALIHSFIGFKVYKLCFTAVILNAIGFAKTFLNRSIITFGSCIESILTKIVLVPHLITWPPVFFRHKLLKAFKSSHGSSTDLCTESPATCRIAFQAIGILGKVETWFKSSPRATTRQTLCMRICLEITVTTIESLNILGHPTF